MGLSDTLKIASSANQAQKTNNPYQDQYQTGWWSGITGGAKEKASAIAMAEVDRRYQSAEAQRQMDYQSREAQLNRDYQERLSSSAYQRAVEDLKKAGLNPALMYKSMDGASTPSGSSPSGASGSGSRSTPPAASTGQLTSLIAGAVGGAIMATSRVASAMKAAGINKLQPKDKWGFPKARHY